MSTPGHTVIDPTRIAVEAGASRIRVDLTTGALAPRLVDRDSDSATVALAAAQMLLLDGDSVRIEIEVGSGCTLQIEDVGGTVAYPGSSSWQVRARVGAGGALLWRGLPFVVTSEALSRRRTEIELEPGASALIRETLVLGRHGELGGAIDSAFVATMDGGAILTERLQADAAYPGPGVLGVNRVVDSVIALGYRPPGSPGHLELEHPGAIARFLGANTHSSGLDAVWREWQRSLVNAGASIDAG